jgi:hypothetical protein
MQAVLEREQAIAREATARAAAAQQATPSAPGQVSHALPAGQAPPTAAQPGPVAGVWRGPPPGRQAPQRGWHGPPPAWQQPAPAQRPRPVQHAQPAGRLDRSSWPGAEVVPRDRDTAQRVGDALYPLVRWLRDSRLGWFGVIALFGITLPIILLREDFDVRLRLVLGFFSVIFWIQLLSELIPG